MSKIANFIGDNAVQVDATGAEKALRASYPALLHAKETVELAFANRGGAGRDQHIFSSHRLLLVNVKGLGKRKNFLSVPYSALQAFAIETAGALDGDVELRLYQVGKGWPIQIDFAKAQVDIFAINDFFNRKIVARDAENRPALPRVHDIPLTTKKSGAVADIFNFLGDNAKQINAAAVQASLTSEPTPVLMQGETVELAFKSGRDTVLFTDKRLLRINVKGITGKRVEFLSVIWSSISGFAVETAGSTFLDGDSELKLYTSIIALPFFYQDLRKAQADLFAIQTAIANKVLGPDSAPLAGVNRLSGHLDPKTSWIGRSNARPLDADEMDRVFHSSPPILQGGERCEMAFKGLRDVVMFTTKRIVAVDTKGLTGTRIEYLSVPWASIVGFAVETAGSGLDLDAEAKIWTDMMFHRGGGENDPPQPYRSYLTFDFNKGLVDIFAIKRYLSARCMGTDKPSVQIKPSMLMISAPDNKVESFISKIGGDQRAIDVTELNRQLHSQQQMLMEDENIIMAFKAGRDTTAFTNLRILSIDVKGITGKRVQFTSIEYSRIISFATESAGDWDRDSELKIYTRNLWNLQKIKLDFRKGKADIVVIQKLLSAMVLGNLEDAADYLESAGAPPPGTQKPKMSSFTTWLTSNSVKEDAGAIEEQLRMEMPVLLSDEHCEKVYRSGRDLYVYTNKRLLLIDVQGLRGKKVEYLTVPLGLLTGFAVQTQGHMDRDAEVYIYTDVPAKGVIQQDILVKRGDVMEMQEYLTEKLVV